MNVSRLSLAVIFSIILFSGTTSVAIAGGGVPTTILGDFKCYLPDLDEIGPPIDPVANVGLEDQFRTLNDVDLFDRELFCGHVIKNIDGIMPEFPDQHYWTYDIIVNDILTQDCFDVEVIDQFMTTTHSICGPPDELWVPAEKDEGDIQFPIRKDTHYLCYDITGDSADEPALLFDQFTDLNAIPSGPGFEAVTVLEPTHLCNPVIKTVNSIGGIPDNGAVFGEINDEHLKCYDIVNDNTEPGSEHDSIANVNIFLTDQFSPLTALDPPPFVDDITSDTFEKLCVVAEKFPIIDDEFCDIFPNAPSCVVGGEFLPIETTSLLLAAASSPASWLTTLTIAALGIGAYVFTRNPNNMRNIKIILRDYLDRF